MSVPSGMQVGLPVSAADVRYIYEALTAGEQEINIGTIFLNIMCASSDPIYIHSLDLIDSTESNREKTSLTDINDIFNLYSMSAMSTNHGHIKKISWIDSNLRIYKLTAICMQKGISTYTWVEISRGIG